MKIIIVLNYLNKHGGVERMVSNLSSELSKYNDYEVEVLSLFKENKNNVYPISKNVSIRYVIPHTRYKSKLYRRKKIAQEIRGIVRNNNEVVIISTSASITLLLFLFSIWKKGKRIIAWEHSLLSEQVYFNKIIYRTIYNHLDCIITINSLDYEYMKKISDRTEFIENFIINKNVMKSSLSNSSIISVGRLEYEKGFDNLIFAMKEINKNYPEWKLNIYGDGSQKKYLEKLIDNLGLKKVVYLKGFTNEIEKKYSESSVYLMGSRSESSPLTLLEAISFGLIVIVPKISTSIINNAKHATKSYIYEKNVINDLVNKLEKAIEDIKKNNFKINTIDILQNQKTSLKSWVRVLNNCN